MNTTSRIVITILILLIIGGVAAWVWFNGNQDNQSDTNPVITTTPTPTRQQSTTSPSLTPTGASSNDSNGEIKEFTVSNEGNSFTPDTLTVNQGDTVRITYQSVGNVHTFTLPEFNVDTGNVNPGDSETVEFVAESQGEFEFYCSIHRSMGMTGTLIVN